MGSSRRWWLNQDTHSSVANSTASMRAAIRVANQAAVAFGLTVVQRLLQRIEHEVRAHRAAVPPAHDARGEHVDHEGEVEPTLPGRDVRLSRARAPLATGSIACPLAEPDVHLSLCIRLSRNHGEVGGCHPPAFVALHLQPAHLVLLVPLTLPHASRRTVPAGSSVSELPPHGGLRVLLPHPAPHSVPHVVRRPRQTAP